ncbi:unnamed protein product [Phytophthora lilii]|uniref:Unnamed protein product n=1 Tax=Phytophthora lilii TaxID=2077276 RepID=A0A9W6U5F2_9STRA|nr:unnamed protein product [Phytophthora lilii]
MNFVINQGWALYWGTSSWSSADIKEACDIADRLGLVRPIVEQPQYNLIERSRWSLSTSTSPTAFTPDFADRVAKADLLKPIAEELGVSMAAFAIAWCLSNSSVTTVLVGAKTTKQLEQNLEAFAIVD